MLSASAASATQRRPAQRAGPPGPGPGRAGHRRPERPEHRRGRDQQAGQVPGALHRSVRGGAAGRVRDQAQPGADHQGQPSTLADPLDPGRGPQRPDGQHPGQDQQHRIGHAPPELPRRAPAGRAEPGAHRHPEQDPAVEPIGPGRDRATAEVGVDGPRTVGRRGGQVVHHDRHQPDQQAASEREPGPADQLTPVGQEQQHPGHGHVRQHQPVVPQGEAGDQPPAGVGQHPSPTRPTRRTRTGGADGAEAQVDREQHQQHTGRVHLRVTAAGDELVLQDPIGAECQQADRDGGQPRTVEPAGELPDQGQERGVQQQVRQPQGEGGRARRGRTTARPGTTPAHPCSTARRRRAGTPGPARCASRPGHWSPRRCSPAVPRPATGPAGRPRRPGRARPPPAARAAGSVRSWSLGRPTAPLSRSPWPAVWHGNLYRPGGPPACTGTRRPRQDSNHRTRPLDRADAAPRPLTIHHRPLDPKECAGLIERGVAELSGPARLGRVNVRPPYLRRTRTRAAVAFCAAAVLATSGCAFGEPEPDPAGEPPNFPTPSVTATPRAGGVDQQVAATVLASELQVPWGIAFLPDGGALVTERDTAKILQGRPGVRRRTGSRSPRCRPLAEVDAAGEGGLMGIAVSPTYDQDKTVFVYYSTSEDNRIAKLVLGGKPAPIVTGIPLSGIHNGGRLAFGPDGFLYATTGDASQRGLSQDPKSLGGKILRMTAGRQAGRRQPVPQLAGLVARPPQRAGHRLGREQAAVRQRVRPEHLGRDQPDRARQELRLARGRGAGRRGDRPEVHRTAGGLADRRLVLLRASPSWRTCSSPPACAASGSGCST